MHRQDPVEESVRHLAGLGFTELEASVYAFLVGHSPATGYRVAQGIGRPVANTYKAVESLAQKGAVLVDETGGNRLWRAVPPDELLLELRKRFEERQAAAARALARVSRAEEGDGVFALGTDEQVFGRCIGMLEGATEVVLLDVFPAMLEDLRPAVETAARRGVLVVVQAYSEIELEGAELIVQADAERTLRRWPGQWLCLVVDGAEYLFAYLDGAANAVHQAIWSASPFLAWVNHSYLAGSLRDQVIGRLLEEGVGSEEIARVRARTERWLAPGARGYRALRERFGEGHPAAEDDAEAR